MSWVELLKHAVDGAVEVLTLLLWLDFFSALAAYGTKLLHAAIWAVFWGLVLIKGVGRLGIAITNACKSG